MQKLNGARGADEINQHRLILNNVSLLWQNQLRRSFDLA